MKILKLLSGCLIIAGCTFNLNANVSLADLGIRDQNAFIADSAKALQAASILMTYGASRGGFGHAYDPSAIYEASFESSNAGQLVKWILPYLPYLFDLIFKALQKQYNANEHMSDIFKNMDLAPLQPDIEGQTKILENYKEKYSILFEKCGANCQINFTNLINKKE